MKFDKQLGRRVGMSLFGVVICAISVGIFKIAALGVDPFQAFMAGLDDLVPTHYVTMFGKEFDLFGFGTLYVIVNAIMFIFMLVFDKHFIVGSGLFLMAGGKWGQVYTIAGAGTIVTAFFMGPLIDFFNNHCAIPFMNRGKKEE